MTVEKLAEALTHEIRIREAEYHATLDMMARRIAEAKERPVSTHPGFNLGSNASDLQAIAAKVEAARGVLLALQQGGAA